MGVICKLRHERTTQSGRPTRKWPGVSASTPSPFVVVTGARGLLFKHASTWVSTVLNSSYVSFTFPATFLRCFLKLRTAASQRPPKSGTLCGMKCHCMPCELQESITAVCNSVLLRWLCSSVNSQSAPTKLVPWSLKMSVERPRWLVKCRNVVRKASVVSSVTSSRCLTTIQTNIFSDCGFLSWSVFDQKGSCIINSHFTEDMPWS